MPAKNIIRYQQNHDNSPEHTNIAEIFFLQRIVYGRYHERDCWTKGKEKKKAQIFPSPCCYSCDTLHYILSFFLFLLPESHPEGRKIYHESDRISMLCDTLLESSAGALCSYAGYTGIYYAVGCIVLACLLTGTVLVLCCTHSERRKEE